MYSFPLPAELLAAAPAISARLAQILGALAALIARGLLKDPLRVAWIVPLWNYIGRTARRVDRALARVALPRRPSRPGAPRAAGKPPIRLPRRRAWLVEALRHEAVAYALQLGHLLDEPEAKALVQASPQARRLLRPICHLLGIRPDALQPPPPGHPRAGRAPSRDAGQEQARAAVPRHVLASARDDDAPARPPRLYPPPCPRLVGRWPWNWTPPSRSG